MLTLDLTIPFVEAIMQGREAEAVVLLREAEERSGLEVCLDKHEILPPGCFAPRQGAGPSGAAWADAFEHWDKFQEHFVEIDEEPFAEQFEAKLHGFLNQTHLLVQGMDFTNGHCLRERQGRIHAWTSRAWGGELARWANAVHWNGKHKWDYVDFYCDAHLLIRRYDDWCGTVLRVIAAKCQRYGLLEPAP